MPDEARVSLTQKRHVFRCYIASQHSSEHPPAGRTTDDIPLAEFILSHVEGLGDDVPCGHDIKRPPRFADGCNSLLG